MMRTSKEGTGGGIYLCEDFEAMTTVRARAGIERRGNNGCELNGF